MREKLESRGCECECGERDSKLTWENLSEWEEETAGKITKMCFHFVIVSPSPLCKY